MRMDAHQHYWQLSRGDYGWLTPDAGLLYQDYLPSQLSPLLQQHDVMKSVVVQAAPTLEETEFLLELCQKETTLAGVVGWLNLEDENFAEQLKRLNLNPFFLGLRPSFHIDGNNQLAISRKVMNSLELIADLEVPLDLLVHPQQLADWVAILKQIPELRVVLNHLGNPFIGEAILDPWRSDLEQFAQFNNAYCKLSGLVTRMDKEQDFISGMKPFVQHAVSCFGTERVMYGSDWPVCLLAASYKETQTALIQALSPLSEIQFNNIFGLTAQRFYRIL